MRRENKGDKKGSGLHAAGHVPNCQASWRTALLHAGMQEPAARRAGVQ